ncbi:MAG TPA: transglycosylase SLT domain-containing protein [Bdellovibrionales bacterium]|nr:transglycosylase SLT domain-containing protein [Bdellovibrionales bacterium]
MEMDLLPQYYKILAIVCCLLTAGCARIATRRPAQTKSVPVYVASDEIRELELAEPERPEAEIPPQVIEAKIREADQEILEDEARNGAPLSRQIPTEINRRVEKWIQYFSKKDRARFQRFINRGLTYRPMIHKVLDERQMPRELYYLAMIESGFRKTATSHVGAGGVWQFMPGTGRDYGLTVNAFVDERRSPEHATRAAIEYIKDLHNLFGSWYLAIAAYNAGEFRIIGAIRRANTRNFWELVDKKALPEETMDYVPKFIAATIVGRAPAQYGFSERIELQLPNTELARIPSGATLKAVARASGVAEATLRELNPQLIKRVVPPTRSGYYAISVPAGQRALFETRVARVLAEEREQRLKAEHARKLASSRAAKIKTYRVRPGDTLTSIAAKTGVPVQKLKRVNKLRREKIYAGQILKVARN